MPQRRLTIVATIVAVVVSTGVGVVAATNGSSGAEAGGARPASAVRGYQPAHRGGTLRILASTSAGSLDPQVNYTPQYWQLFPAVYDGLLAFAQVDGPQSLDVVPDLAEALPSVQDGGKRYVFTLRRGVRFSTGVIVSAEDVAASLRRIFMQGAPIAASAYRSIVGADACLAAPKVCTLAGGVLAEPAPGRVTINLVAPDPDFPLKLAIPPAVVLPAGTPAQDTATSPPPGTGAYRFDTYDPGSSVTLSRNPYFVEWNRAAQPDGYPDRIVQEFGHEPAAALTAVEGGQADTLYDEPASQLWPELTRAGTAKLHVNALPASWYLAMNVHVAPFDQLPVRQAVNWAVDRAAAVRLFGGASVATPACTVLPAGIRGHRDDCQYSRAPGHPWQAPDLEQARRLVQGSGTAGRRVRLVVADDAVSRAIGTNVAETLRAIGFRAAVKVLPADLQYRYVQDPGNGVQISLTNWFQDYPSPAAFLQVLLGCGPPDSPAPAETTNLSGYCDRGVQARMDAAAALTRTDPAAAARAWGEVDHDLMAAAPIAPLITPSHVDVVATRVGNYQWSRQSRMILSQLWVR